MSRDRSNPQRGSSTSLVGWFRRRALPRCAQLCALLGLVILGLWITGRVLTDQYRWAQYIWWVPSIWMVGSAWVCLGVSALLALFSRRLGGLFLRPALLVACIGCTGYLFIGVWHMHRVFSSNQRADDSIRIVHWNQSSKHVDQTGWAISVLDQEADIVFVANASWGEERQELLDSFAPFAPLARERWVNYSYRVHGEPAHYRVEGNALIASRFPMIRTGLVYMHAPTNQEDASFIGSSNGWVLFAEFDLGESESTSESLIVWFVDLPSDPASWRQESMQNASNAIHSWNGRSWIMGRNVWELSHTESSFPEPDVIIGDFNTVRGSKSLQLLAPKMSDAFSAVGYGRGRSWVPEIDNRLLRQPFKLADWHIDLALVGANWMPTRYRIEDTRRWGQTEHRMQILDLIEKTPE